MSSILESLTKVEKLIALYEDKKDANWFAGNIEETTLSNDLYRNVLFTGTNLQLVVMSIEPGEEIGLETHESGDQFIRIESGTGEFVVDGNSQPASDGDSVLIPAGVEHNVINAGDQPLKLYALYSPPEHDPDTKIDKKKESISEKKKHNNNLTELQSCPRTKATICECDSVKQLTESKEATTAVCVLEHSDTVEGTILFKQEATGPTLIVGKITGLKPGKHGFHIHEYGDLSQGCESAGAHYNPDGVDHGDLDKGHVGDLGNVTADENGVAVVKIVADRVDLTGERSVVGRSVVVHSDEDDLGKGGDEESLKTGNAGDRLACGVITLKETVNESWSKKYKDSINCSNPKGFSQKAHCAGKKKKNRANESPNLTETFNSPYPVQVVKLDKKFGVPRYQANVKLPDNSDMRIIFMRDSLRPDKDSRWEAEFYRDGSLGITGKGDAFRVFATMIEAIRQFIELEEPQSIIFSATKELEDDDVGNEESRTKLYKRMVTRFANSMGYDAVVDDYIDWEQYELTNKNIKKTESSIMRGIQHETKGIPYPGTYQQEYGRFKKKGQRRTTNMTD